MTLPAARDTASPPRMGAIAATALVLGNIVGSGIYLLPATLAPYGMTSLPAWAFTITGALLVARVFATLARAAPAAGGPYAYARHAFGPRVAFAVAWGYWISIWVGNAAIATGAVAYLGVLHPPLVATPAASCATTLAAIAVFTASNALGARRAGDVQVATTVLKIVPLVVVAVLGVLAVAERPRLVADAFAATTFGLAPVGAAAALTLWSLLGLESATVPADKVRDPARNVARATLWGTAIAAVLYVLSCTAVQFLVPAATLATSSAPFADAMRATLGDGAAIVVAVFAAISALGALNGWILLHGELARAMAADGVFPRVFARVDARGTPVASIVIGSALAAALVLLNASHTLVEVFTFMVLLSTTGSLAMYLSTAVAALVLHRRGALPGLARPRAFAVVAALAVAYAVWMLVGAGGVAVAWGAALLATALPVHAWMRWRARAR